MPHTYIFMFNSVVKAVKKKNTTGERASVNVILYFHYRRFSASGAEEQEQRILYTNVLEYEQDHVSLQVIATHVSKLMAVVSRNIQCVIIQKCLK